MEHTISQKGSRSPLFLKTPPSASTAKTPTRQYINRSPFRLSDLLDSLPSTTETYKVASPPPTKRVKLDSYQPWTSFTASTSPIKQDLGKKRKTLQETPPRTRVEVQEGKDEEEVEEQQVEDQVGKQVSSSASKKRQRKAEGLSLHLQNQLFTDIERAGGVHLAKLHRVCNRRTDLYGSPGSGLRKQIQNKVNWARRLSPERLDKYRRYLSISQQESEVWKVYRDTPNSIIDSDDEEDYIDEQVKEEQSFEVISFTPTKKERNVAAMSMIHRSKFGRSNEDAEEYANIIEVDMEYAERNVPFLIYSFRDVEKNGILHNSVFIVFQTDGRDITNERYFKAKILAHNIIRITVPSMSYPLLMEQYKFDQYMKDWDMYCDRVAQSMEIVRNNILEDDERKTQIYILKFPEHFEFSNVVFNEESGVRDGDIDGDFAIVSSSYLLNEEKIETTSAVMMWKIALVEKTSRVVRRKDASSNAMAEKLKKRMAKGYPGSCDMVPYKKPKLEDDDDHKSFVSPKSQLSTPSYFTSTSKRQRSDEEDSEDEGDMKPPSMVVKDKTTTKKQKMLPPMITSAMNAISLHSGPGVASTSSPLTQNSPSTSYIGDIDEVSRTKNGGTENSFVEDNDAFMDDERGLLKRYREQVPGEQGEDSSDEADKKKPPVFLSPLITAAYQAFSSQFTTVQQNNQQYTTQETRSIAPQEHGPPSLVGTITSNPESASRTEDSVTPGFKTNTEEEEHNNLEYHDASSDEYSL